MFKLFAIAAAILVVAVGTATAATGPTAQGLKADGLRWQALARFYANKPTTVSASSSFHWSDAGVGAGAGLAVVAIGGAAIVLLRRGRRTKLAV
jgi:hypothetical protein